MFPISNGVQDKCLVGGPVCDPRYTRPSAHVTAASRPRGLRAEITVGSGITAVVDRLGVHEVTALQAAEAQRGFTVVPGTVRPIW